MTQKETFVIETLYGFFNLIILFFFMKISWNYISINDIQIKEFIILCSIPVFTIAALSLPIIIPKKIKHKIVFFIPYSFFSMLFLSYLFYSVFFNQLPKNVYFILFVLFVNVLSSIFFTFVCYINIFYEPEKSSKHEIEKKINKKKTSEINETNKINESKSKTNNIKTPDVSKSDDSNNFFGDESDFGLENIDDDIGELNFIDKV